MFFLIPINTDAPIYHWPWATLSMIVVNIVAFVVTFGGYPGYEAHWQPWMLEYGNGLNPVEWVSMNFLHFGITHLIGNMIFLWGCGVVVEGKLGWRQFLLVYFVIRILGAFISQTWMLGYDGAPAGAGGASLIIFGLLAMSLVWAPKNDMTIFWFVWVIVFLRFGLAEVSILTFSVCYIGFEFASFWLRPSFLMSSELGHLLGAAIGFAVGTVLLKQRWVDCENWDLFAVLKGTHGSTYNLDQYRYPEHAEEIKSSDSSQQGSKWFGKDADQDDATPGEKKTIRKAKLLGNVRGMLAANKPNAALSELRALENFDAHFQLPSEDLKSLANGLYKAKAYNEAATLFEQYIERFPDASAHMHLRLAGILLEVEQRPRHALRVLDNVIALELDDELARNHAKMVKTAQRLIDEGVMELDGRAWS